MHARVLIGAPFACAMLWCSLWATLGWSDAAAQASDGLRMLGNPKRCRNQHPGLSGLLSVTSRGYLSTASTSPIQRQPMPHKVKSSRIRYLALSAAPSSAPETSGEGPSLRSG